MAAVRAWQECKEAVLQAERAAEAQAAAAAAQTAAPNGEGPLAADMAHYAALARQVDAAAAEPTPHAMGGAGGVPWGGVGAVGATPSVGMGYLIEELDD